MSDWPEETGELPRVVKWLDETEELPPVAEWLDETGELPSAAGWLDETEELPPVAEWLDETGELPPVAEWLDETGELPSAAEWLDETGALPSVTDWPDKTQELPHAADRQGEAALSDAFEELPDSEQQCEETKELPRLMLRDWDDTLDDEPADWSREWVTEEEIPEENPLPPAADERGGELPPDGQVPEPADENAGGFLPDGQVPAAGRQGRLTLFGDESRLPEPICRGICRIRETGEEIWEALRKRWIRHDAFDAAAAALGVVIVVALVSAVVSCSGSRKLQEQRLLLAAVGEDLTGDQVLNTDPLEQLAELRIRQEQEEAAAQEAARQKAQKEAEQDEEEESVAVDFTLSTIQSDLKIKIRRQKEQSIIGGVPFTVKVKGPNGKITEQKDTDEDGIVYLTGLSNGKYEVSLCSLIDLEEIKQQEDYRENEEYLLYSKYKISDQSQTIDVTDRIAYEVVDVSDEVKSASEVNAAKEDTAKNDTPVESTVKDTVEWVESTKTEVDGGDASYVEVPKSEVPDPYAAACLSSGGFRKLSEVSDAGADSGGQDAAAEGTDAAGSAGSDAADSAGTEGGGTQNGEGTEGGDSNAGQENAAPELSVDPSEIHLTVGKTQTIQATVSNASNTTVTYVSSDAAIATVSDGGTVQGVAAGSCSVTVSLKDYGDVTRTVSVTVSEGVDDLAALKDSGGNPLYVREAETYRAATAADYNSFDTFYRKTVTQKQYKYTGWQHINGLTYYYDKDGNYVTGAQIIQGVSYTFSSEGILDVGSSNTGVDVSMWNGSIQWSEVASSGISFAIIRCGYRGSSTGALVKDSAVGTNVTGAKNAGLKVGLYFFSQAINEAEAVEEASMAVQIARSYGISMPIFLDVESSGGRGDAISVSQRTANIAAFCKTVQNAGFSAGVYANTNWFSEKINVGSLTSYHIWLAQYAEAPTYSGSRYDIWQYSATGRINGISGNVDLDISYRTY